MVLQLARRDREFFRFALPKKVLDYLMGFDKKEETNKGEKKWDLIYTH